MLLATGSDLRMLRAQVSVGGYRVLASSDEWPETLASYREHARLAEDFTSADADGRSFFSVHAAASEWPELVVTQTYAPAGYGFPPGLLIVPETATVFIGAGARLLAYRLKPAPRRLWVDEAFVGFWFWKLHGNVVVMGAELEIAAWSAAGEKLWSTGVQPPWTYEVDGDRITVNVEDESPRTFSITRGP